MKRIVKISEYPYGKINLRLRKAADWINRNQNKIKKQITNGELDLIDYPDYWDMPKTISRKLMGEEVDFLQDQTYDFYSINKGYNLNYE